MKISFILVCLARLVSNVQGVNFPWEEEDLQLTDDYVAEYGYDGIAFGDTSAAPDPSSVPDCRAFPDTDAWPSDADWAELEYLLDGALLKPSPPAAVCYAGPLEDDAQCRSMMFGAGSGRFFIDDPVTVLTQWPQGNTCPMSVGGFGRGPKGGGGCEQGGFPTYVVNVTAVWQIQTAVNFARNHNVRLVVKNTGHDWVGRSLGAGSISIWTHHLKDFEFLPEYTNGAYSGPAARVGSGVEAWEMFDRMDDHGVTFAVPGGTTVGAYGGWMQGGGHSAVASRYGFGSDQVLSLQVVMADGRFVTADAETNAELFYGLRGGGPATYGIVTSAVVKAHPATRMRMSSLSFSAGRARGGGGGDTDTFWTGVNWVHWYAQYITAAGGTIYDYVYPQGSYSAEIELPGQAEEGGGGGSTGDQEMSDEEMVEFLAPLYDSLRDLGLSVRQPAPRGSENFAPSRNRGRGDAPGDSRFASRLFSNADFGDEEAFDKTIGAIRSVVEGGGCTVHGVHLAAGEAVAGFPGADSAINPAFRNARIHADVFPGGRGWSGIEQYMDVLREATPGSGAYINEADVQEPDFQQAFFGDKYERLAGIKRAVDPWGLFWAPSTVGSEGWAVRTGDGEATQNGPLCKVGG